MSQRPLRTCLLLGLFNLQLQRALLQSLLKERDLAEEAQLLLLRAQSGMVVLLFLEKLSDFRVSILRIGRDRENLIDEGDRSLDLGVLTMLAWLAF